MTTHPGSAAGRERLSGAVPARGRTAPARHGDDARAIGAHLIPQSGRQHNLRTKVRAGAAMTGGGRRRRRRRRQRRRLNPAPPGPRHPGLRRWQLLAPSPGRSSPPAPRGGRAWLRREPLRGSGGAGAGLAGTLWRRRCGGGRGGKSSLPSLPATAHSRVAAL